jgi:tRNA-uridine 2-sulfurtransferase
MSNRKRKAIALISGGLDSLLAAKVIMEQGIHVEGINFYSGFFGVGSACTTTRKKQEKKTPFGATWVADQLGIKLHVIDAVTEFKEVLLNPRYGYGKNLNPCLDCKIFIVKKAKEWILKNNFDFIVTGEVVGQRPMSQRKDTMPVVAKRSAANELLLRPLSAKLLPPTLPELEGWVEREKLYDFSGRNRKPQIALAKQFGFEEFPQPAGGCLLTEAGFVAKLKDFWQFKGERDYVLDEVDLLKVGRHVYPAPHFKMIIGREEGDNQFLEKYKDKYTHMFCLSHPGPFALVEGEVNQEDLVQAAKIIVGFSKAKSGEAAQVTVKPLGGDSYDIKVIF